MGAIFRFKEFAVNQQDCAMKINTDAVLLGAMAEANRPNTVLDVGSGTGVIALMLAQRFASARVTGVDIDDRAYARTQENFCQSSFYARMEAYHGDFEVLKDRFDMIVSNPPFFINALHNPDERKRLARHADYTFFKRLISFAKNRLTHAGTLQLILPTDLGEEVKVLAGIQGFSLKKEVNISSFVNTEVIRKVLVFEYGEASNTVYEDFVIYQDKGVYSEQYRSLLKPFFLAF